MNYLVPTFKSNILAGGVGCGSKPSSAGSMTKKLSFPVTDTTSTGGSQRREREIETHRELSC